MTRLFAVNQIVKGRVGTFVILGFKVIGDEDHAIVKEVNPDDYTQTNPGQLAVPVSVLRYVN